MLDKTAHEQDLHRIREQYEKIFFDRNLGLVQGGYFTQCPPELLEISVAESEHLADELDERGYPIDSLPSQSVTAAGEYDSVVEAYKDITNRLERTPGQSNWLADQLNETIIRDWSEALSGLEPNEVITAERATKLKQIKQLYEASKTQLASQADDLGIGILNSLSEAETLFVGLLRDLQNQTGVELNVSQVRIKHTLNQDYELRGSSIGLVLSLTTGVTGLYRSSMQILDGGAKGATLPTVSRKLSVTVEFSSPVVPT